MSNELEIFKETLLTELQLRRLELKFYIILDKDNNTPYLSNTGKVYIIFQDTNNSSIIAIPYELGKFNLSSFITLKEVKVDFPNVKVTTTKNDIYRGTLLLQNELNTAYDFFVRTSLVSNPKNDEVYYTTLVDHNNKAIQDFLNSPTGIQYPKNSSHGENSTLDFSEKVYNNIQHENILIFALDCNSTIQLNLSTNQIYVFETDSYLSNAKISLSNDNTQISIEEIDGTTYKGFRISNSFLSSFRAGNKFSSCGQNPTLDFRKKDSNSNSLENASCGQNPTLDFRKKDNNSDFKDSSCGQKLGYSVGGVNPISTQVCSYSEPGVVVVNDHIKIKGVMEMIKKIEKKRKFIGEFEGDQITVSFNPSKESLYIIESESVIDGVEYNIIEDELIIAEYGEVIFRGKEVVFEQYKKPLLNPKLK